MPKARILAVDDQLYFRVFLEDLLTQEGYEVTTASGGEEALHLFERGDFDVVLTDLVMPGMDGTSSSAHQGLRPDQDVVVITSVGDVKTAVDAMKLGATDYLLKPIDRTVLARALEGILQRRRLREEHARLMAENLEFMGAFSLYERGLGLLRDALAGAARGPHRRGALPRDARARRRASGSRARRDPSALRLAGVRGLVRPDEEPEELALDGAARRARPLSEPLRPPFLAPAPTRPEPRTDARRNRGRAWRALWVAAPPRGAAARRGCASPTASTARRSATRSAPRPRSSRSSPRRRSTTRTRFASLERRSFRDPVTKTYTRAYFDDVVHNEIHKAARFGRTFSLVRLELEGLGDLRARASEAEFVGVASSRLRSTWAARSARPTSSPRSPRAASACCCPRPTRSAPRC